MRVQIPAYTDRWMMGDRYGEVVKVKLAKHLVMSRDISRDIIEVVRETAFVKLDKSGKTVRFILDDCTVLA